MKVFIITVFTGDIGVVQLVWGIPYKCWGSIQKMRGLRSKVREK